MNTTSNHHPRIHRWFAAFVLAAWATSIAYIADATGYFMPVIIAGAMGSAPFILLAVAVLMLAAHTLPAED
ncbi:hypothetical protein ICV35_25060 [Rhodococcus ruber]|uniref:hypothetical protein n=1 Tax=Rhodococcus ruber TaxID=1830 RepID=UPI00177D7742|nr:hypothetical protein [Rhodococcus ruber]MBD8056920.1 hypothetical protein [Rhodococcus ruber]